jgi:hypothetical protein
VLYLPLTTYRVDDNLALQMSLWLCHCLKVPLDVLVLVLLTDVTPRRARVNLC